MTANGPHFRKSHLVARRRAALAARRRPAPEPAGMSIEDALTTLRDAPAVVRAVLDTHRVGLAEAMQGVEQDPGLSDQGRDAQRVAFREQFGQETAREGAGLRQAVTDAAAALSAHAARAMPKPAAGVEALMARQIAWNRAKEMLDAGVPLDEVIGETVDPEALHALREELPAYLRIKEWEPAARVGAVRVVDEQLAHVAGGPVLAAYTAAQEAAQHLDRIGPLLDHVEQVGAGQARPERGMVAVTRAEHAARQISSPAADPEGASGDVA